MNPAYAWSDAASLTSQPAPQPSAPPRSQARRAALLAALLSPGLCSAAAAPPQAWEKWTDEVRASLRKPYSYAFVAVRRTLSPGERKGVYRTRGGRLIVADEASGRKLGELRAAEKKLFFAPAGAAEKEIDFEKGEDFPAPSLGLSGLTRDEGVMVFVHDLSRRRQGWLKKTEFFPHDPGAVVRAAVEKPAEPRTKRLATSDGAEKEYAVLGTARFDYGGKRQSLTLYRSAGAKDDRGLFLLFRDKTSGRETYGAARYLNLDLDKPFAELDALTIDFNYAYNPYCARSPAFSCPLPEDFIDARVSAGEKAPRR